MKAGVAGAVFVSAASVGGEDVGDSFVAVGKVGAEKAEGTDGLVDGTAGKVEPRMEVDLEAGVVADESSDGFDPNKFGNALDRPEEGVEVAGAITNGLGLGILGGTKLGNNGGVLVRVATFD